MAEAEAQPSGADTTAPETGAGGGSEAGGAAEATLAGGAPTGEAEPSGGSEANGDAPQLPEGFDWRTLIGDEKARKTFGRFDNLDQAAKSYANLQAELGNRPKPMERPGADASAEDLAAYRKHVGAPEKPEDYLKGFTPPDHFDPETDQAALDSFAEFAHEQHWNADQFAGARDWYFDMEAKRFQELNEAANAQQDEARRALTAELGGDERFKHTMVAVNRYGAEAVGDEAWSAFINQRMADGTVLGDNPALLRAMGAVARDAYGEDLVTVTGDRASQITDLEARIAPLDQKLMEARNGGPSLSPTEQAEHQRLAKAIASRTGKA